MKTIWVLSDGKPGHYNQSLAVAEALQTLTPATVDTIPLRVRGMGKYLLRGLLNRKWGRWILKHLFSPNVVTLFYDVNLPAGRPDIVVSSGKDTSMLNALLGLWYGAKTLYVGNPKKLDNRLFTHVLTVLDLGFDNQIVLDVAPTRPYRGDLELFCNRYKLDPNARYWSLLIGGDGAGYHYTQKEIEALIAFVNATSNRVQWLVTTSRRTPEAFEVQMQQQMKAAVFVAYNQKPEKVIGGFLALSEQVFVTEESASMVSEAVASGKPVVTLYPTSYAAEEDYRRILEKFEGRSLLQRQSIEMLGKLSETSVPHMDHMNANKLLIEQLACVIEENQL